MATEIHSSGPIDTNVAIVGGTVVAGGLVHRYVVGEGYTVDQKGPIFLCLVADHGEGRTEAPVETLHWTGARRQ